MLVCAFSATRSTSHELTLLSGLCLTRFSPCVKPLSSLKDRELWTHTRPIHFAKRARYPFTALYYTVTRRVPLLPVLTFD